MTRSALAVMKWAIGTLALACSTTSRNGYERVEVSGGAAGEGPGTTSTSAAGTSGGSAASAGGAEGSGSEDTGGLSGAAGDMNDDSDTVTGGVMGGSTDTSTGSANGSGDTTSTTDGGTGGTTSTTGSGTAGTNTTDGGTGGTTSAGGAGGSGTLTCSPACEGDTPVCLSGTCVPCDPDPTPSSCANQTPQYCDGTGQWQPSPAGECQGGETCSAGECSCTLTVCGSLCTDTSDDPNHCGACDRSCQTGACLDGKCQPVTLASNRDEPWGIAVNETYLYWVDRGSNILYRMTLADGGASPLSLTNSACSRATGAVILDATYVYWGADYACRKAHAGGVEEDLDMWTGDSVALHALAVNSTTAYALSAGDNWLSTPDQGLYAYPLSFVAGIVADDGGLYWLESPMSSSTDAGDIWRTDPTSIDSGASIIASSVGLSEGIAVFDTRVYWTDAAGSVFSVSTAGGTVQTIATGQANPSAVAVDASGVYWTNRSATAGAVMRASLLGGDAAAIAIDQNGPHGITLDSRTVYWTNTDGGEVMKLAKE